jgi:hypothetical protein
MFIYFYTHDILIFTLNYSKILLNIKLHINSICVNESLCMMQILFVHMIACHQM